MYKPVQIYVPRYPDNRILMITWHWEILLFHLDILLQRRLQTGVCQFIFSWSYQHGNQNITHARNKLYNWGINSCYKDQNHFMGNYIKSENIKAMLRANTLKVSLNLVFQGIMVRWNPLNFGIPLPFSTLLSNLLACKEKLFWATYKIHNIINVYNVGWHYQLSRVTCCQQAMGWTCLL